MTSVSRKCLWIFPTGKSRNTVRVKVTTSNLSIRRDDVWGSESINPRILISTLSSASIFFVPLCCTGVKCGFHFNALTFLSICIKKRLAFYKRSSSLSCMTVRKYRTMYETYSVTALVLAETVLYFPLSLLGLPSAFSNSPVQIITAWPNTTTYGIHRISDFHNKSLHVSN